MKVITLLGFLGCICCVNNVKAPNPIIKNDSIIINDSILLSKLENEFDFQNDTIVNDTLIIDSIKFVITTINKQDFINAIKSYQGYSNEKIYQTDYKEKSDGAVLRKDKNTLIFKLKNDKEYILSNEYPGENEIGGTEYRHICHLQSLKSFLVAGQYYESQGCVLIDDSLGLINKETLLHFISIEPKNKRMITYYWDGWAYTSGGFILYNIENSHLNKIASTLYIDSKVGDYYWSLSYVYHNKINEIMFIRQFYRPMPYKVMNCFSKMTIIE